MKKLKITDLKRLMTKLLSETTFDDFFLKDGKISTYIDFLYEGRINKDFFDTDDEEKDQTYVKWARIRENAYNVIKGKRLPGFLQFNFLANDDLKLKIGTHESAEFSLNMGIVFKDKEAFVMTGVYKSEFSLDKTLDEDWDNFVCGFLRENEISYEIL